MIKQQKAALCVRERGLGEDGNLEDRLANIFCEGRFI